MVNYIYHQHISYEFLPYGIYQELSLLKYLRIFLTQQIIGKQPNCEEWVFNTNTQMNADGELIPKEQRKFVVIEGDMKLPQLSHVTGGKC